MLSLMWQIKAGLYSPALQSANIYKFKKNIVFMVCIVPSRPKLVTTAELFCFFCSQRKANPIRLFYQSHIKNSERQTNIDNSNIYQ